MYPFTTPVKHRDFVEMTKKLAAQVRGLSTTDIAILLESLAFVRRSAWPGKAYRPPRKGNGTAAAPGAQTKPISPKALKKAHDAIEKAERELGLDASAAGVKRLGELVRLRNARNKACAHEIGDLNRRIDVLVAQNLDLELTVAEKRYARGCKTGSSADGGEPITDAGGANVTAEVDLPIASHHEGVSQGV